MRTFVRFVVPPSASKLASEIGVMYMRPNACESTTAGAGIVLEILIWRSKTERGAKLPAPQVQNVSVPRL